jgi:hypothetical protein
MLQDRLERGELPEIKELLAIIKGTVETLSDGEAAKR